MELKTLIYTLLVIVNTSYSATNSNPILQLLLRITPEQFYAGNELIYRVLGRANHLNKNVNVQAKVQKLQTRFPDDQPFPCDVSNARSPTRPTSVHRLRPGDIDVVGAMGDSLTAGYGAIAIDVLNVYLANRGVSWSGGGQGTWREYLTLPNILKEFNPNLVGYSLGDALTWQKKAQFNVAEGGAISSDMPHQARILIKRMKSDTRVDFQQDWKLVTFFIGGNDHCGNLCAMSREEYLEDHRKNVIEALDILHEAVPRLLVNLMPGPNLEILMKFTARPGNCIIAHSLECPCIQGLRYKNKQKYFVDIMRVWQEIDYEIGKMERFRDRPDFAVVVQPFSMDITFPQRTLRNGRNVTDYSYMSADCFHFSQKCAAITANALWNNMLEPEAQKARDWNPRLMETFHCPTPEHPYIFTHENS